MFYVPKFAPSSLLLKLLDLNSIDSEVATIKLLFSDNSITEAKMAPFVKRPFDSRIKSFFNSVYFLQVYCQVLQSQ